MIYYKRTDGNIFGDKFFVQIDAIFVRLVSENDCLCFLIQN